MKNEYNMFHIDRKDIRKFNNNLGEFMVSNEKKLRN